LKLKKLIYFFDLSFLASNLPTQTIFIYLSFSINSLLITQHLLSFLETYSYQFYCYIFSYIMNQIYYNVFFIIILNSLNIVFYEFYVFYEFFLLLSLQIFLGKHQVYTFKQELFRDVFSLSLWKLVFLNSYNFDSFFFYAFFLFFLVPNLLKYLHSICLLVYEIFLFF